MALAFTEIAVAGWTVYTFEMPDRRPTAGTSHATLWIFQMNVEAILYQNAFASTGAMYRLLQRTPGAQGRALCLRHRSTAIRDGLCSGVEWDAMVEHLHTGVRSITLVPVAVAVAACTAFGETTASAALIEALGFDRPNAWDTEEEEGEHDGEGGDETDDDDSSSDASDVVSLAATEELNNCEAKSSEDGAVATEGEICGEATTENEGSSKKKARCSAYTLVDVPAALKKELDAFAVWRVKPVNQDRDGGKVELVTVAGNKADALRLLGWLQSNRHIKPSLGGVFGSERLGDAVQAFIDDLILRGRTYTTVAGYLKSFVAISRFVRSVRITHSAPGSDVSSAPVDAMRRAHQQARQQERLEQRFAKKPKAWLNWEEVQMARSRAVRTWYHI